MRGQTSGTSINLGIVLLLFAAWPSRIVAQATTAAITGVVVDAHSRHPLAGALVELKSSPQSVSTDVEGRFRFEAVPVGSHELLVSLVGYAFAKYEVEVPPECASSRGLPIGPGM